MEAYQLFLNKDGTAAVPYITSGNPKADRVYNILIKPEGYSDFIEADVEGYDYGTDVVQTVKDKYGEKTEFSGLNPFDFTDISDFKKKESMNEEADNSSEAKATYKWLRSQVIDTCDDLQREGYVLPKGVLNGDLQLTRDAVEMGVDNPVEVAESLLQYLKDQIRYCSFAQMDWLKEHYEDLRLTLKQYFSACERDQSMNYLDKNFPKMEAVSKERSYEKIDEAKMEDKWDRTSLGYYGGTKYVAYESKDGQTIQISSLHPYDDAEYYWASSKDGGKTYSIIKNGKRIRTYQAEPDAEYNDVVGELVSLNRGIKPEMMYEDFDEQVSEQPDSIEGIDVESEAKWPQVNELIGGRGKFIGKVDEYKDVPIYEYRTNEGQEIVYFLTGPSVLDDRFEFDAKDEEVVVNCIDAYKENGEEAADKVWQNFYDKQ